jgi:hypothetical protein
MNSPRAGHVDVHTSDGIYCQASGAGGSIVTFDFATRPVASVTDRARRRDRQRDSDRRPFTWDTSDVPTGDWRR